MTFLALKDLLSPTTPEKNLTPITSPNKANTTELRLHEGFN